MKVAVIGHGFVGKAVDYGFSNPVVEKKILDPNYGSTPEDVRALANWNPDLTFICVPTPMQDDGDINTSILDEVMSDLSGVSGLIVIKSTITPSTIDKYSQSNVVYNPEFLTERSACEQFVNPEFHIFGGEEEQCELLERYYQEYSLCTPCPSFNVSKAEASFVKYAINSFLATKVTFFNQLYDAVGDTQANFATIIKAIGMDDRIGSSHTKVPGFDGKQGYGGACFPKDTSAFTKYSDKLTLLEKCIMINNDYRLQYDLDNREIEQHVHYG